MRKLLAVLALALLSACAADNNWADDAAVQKVRFVPEGPPSITLFSVLNKSTGAGAHSALLIDGAERVMFDPAGSFKHPGLPERKDRHYGMNERLLAFYRDYYTRETHDLVEQTLVVTPEQAALILARVEANGAAPAAHCARSVSTILGGVPGFTSIRTTWYPNKLSEAFAQLPGVTTRRITDAEASTDHGVILVDADGEPINLAKP
jgi:hypothetical protein